MQSDYDNDLQSYFTDMEHLRGMFKDFVSAEKLPKRLIVFHGVGGVGKSSLLRMFRLHCKSEKIPVALASGDDAKSTLDVITRWMEDLKADGVKFSALHKTLESYRAVQAKVEDQARKSQNKMADMAGKAASKTAEAAGGMVIGAAIGSIVPGVGTAIGGMLGSAVGGMGAEALTDWLRGFLDKSAIDLLLDPAKKLTSDFIEDLAKAAEKKRMVLLLDTYEQMSALEDWVGEAAQKIHPNVLIVIAGRKLPDWQRVWSGWMMNAQVEELKPMTEEVMRDLIHRYYATMRGGEPDPAQVDAIIKFARGLPMVVTSAVQLWVKYGVEDFQSVKAEIVANLVDRLMEGVPSSLIPALEAAAVVRWFDQPILRAVLDKKDVSAVYNELRRFPFVRSRVEGLALHDSVREMMDENLRVQDSERHAELHERAAAYFEKKLEKVTGEEAERLGLERLYHRVRADEEVGIKLFQEMAEELSQYRLDNNLRGLLNDMSTYALEHENNRSWQDYYKAQIYLWRRQHSDAENILKAIIARSNVEPKLRAYAMCDFGYLQRTYNQHELAIVTIKKGLSLAPPDSKLIYNYQHLNFALYQIGKFSEAQETLEEAKNYYQQKGDKYGHASVLNTLKDHYLCRGEPIKARACMGLAMDVLSTISPIPLHLKSRVLRSLAVAWAWYGERHEIELWLREVNTIESGFDPDFVDRSYDAGTGYVLGLEDKYSEALTFLNQSIEFISKFTDQGVEGRLATQRGYRGAILRRLGALHEAEDDLIQSLTIKKRRQDFSGIPEVLVWLGELYEVKALNKIEKLALEKAESHYQDIRNYRQYRPYFDIAAITALIRVKHAQGDLTAIPPLLAEAEQLAQQYEYNDHLASLRLTQGHLRAETSEVSETSEVWSSLDYYKQAMIYALRYNRFLLDELLSGRPQGTPLRPIIPYCLERGEEGKKMLIALRDWWKTGINDVGAPRPDTISPIPEGLPLLEAEKIAREREPGDGSIQRSVIEQIESVLGTERG